MIKGQIQPIFSLLSMHGQTPPEDQKKHIGTDSL